MHTVREQGEEIRDCFFRTDLLQELGYGRPQFAGGNSLENP